MSAFALNPFLEPEDAIVLREWYVAVEGGGTVGPVSAEQIARGIKQGQVPSDAMLARFDRAAWANVLESGAVVAALRAL